MRRGIFVLVMALAISSPAIAVAATTIPAYTTGLTGDIPRGSGIGTSGQVTPFGWPDFRFNKTDMKSIGGTDATGDAWGQVGWWSGSMYGSRYLNIGSGLSTTSGNVKTTVFSFNMLASAGDASKSWANKDQQAVGIIANATNYELRNYASNDNHWYASTSESHLAFTWPVYNASSWDCQIWVVHDYRGGTPVTYYRVYAARVQAGGWIYGYRGGTLSGSVYAPSQIFMYAPDCLTAYAPGTGGASGLGSTPLITSQASGYFFSGQTTSTVVADAVIGDPPTLAEYQEAYTAGVQLPITKPAFDGSFDSSGYPSDPEFPGWTDWNPKHWYDWLWGKMTGWAASFVDLFWWLDLTKPQDGAWN